MHQKTKQVKALTNSQYHSQSTTSFDAIDQEKEMSQELMERG
jgi:hypothetical protein